MELDRAIQIACNVHMGKKDLAGKPYILHPLRVMLQMDTELEMIIAVLHDVIEDGGSLEFHLARFSYKVVMTVETLSRRKGEPYEDYIKRVSKSRIATKVKLADLEDNLDPVRTAMLDPIKNEARREKYILAHEYLIKNRRT